MKSTLIFLAFLSVALLSAEGKATTDGTKLVNNETEVNNLEVTNHARSQDNWRLDFEGELLDIMFEVSPEHWPIADDETEAIVGDNVSRGAHALFPEASKLSLRGWTASATNGHVELSWVTTSENNNKYFTIEKSSDALNWYVLGIVKAACTKPSETQYKFEDKNPLPAATYYRLSQTSSEGVTEMFDVRKVAFDFVDRKPAVRKAKEQKAFEIRLEDPLYDLEYATTVLDHNGTPVEFSMRQESDGIFFDVSSLAPGQYSVQFDIGDYDEQFDVVID
ncbi:MULTISPECIES: hypothetical protein [unclassified Imperialibacter]|uniref:hypothetical protein n=1 Tax=unclassified Imperialibacter TaxID=2629706 RepID=UPI001253477E|nr:MULTISPECIES: hypothetical protein [unclassified Imperialibacter]CAD5280982.1 exported hypothetical protein [Imperialibacter sp. 75]CAD5296318.1 exported hypothetical protein [Imperialibacter sp. 89]VVT27791.1 exported hypothetical protein [Imperialibacter sp. EC-SDR9]